jgi:hypothetical protein
MMKDHENQLTKPVNEIPRPRYRVRFAAREKRLLVYLVLVMGIAAWKFIPRPWHPTFTLKTPHHTIFSTATFQQTRATANAMTLVYECYSNNLGVLPGFDPRHRSLKVKLYQDRDELRSINPGMGWAEAFYSKPYCRAYYAGSEPNPYHWMLHESVHQLNEEVAHLKLAKWLEEGLADYYGTSQLTTNGLALGEIDPNTYPVWWMHILATAPRLEENIRNQSVIPLRVIITNRGGPSLRGHFNLYYLHWWTLTHFIFESPQYHDNAVRLVKAGGGLTDFELLIGPVEKIQKEWHLHVRKLKDRLSNAPDGAKK